MNKKKQDRIFVIVLILIVLGFMWYIHSRPELVIIPRNETYMRNTTCEVWEVCDYDMCHNIYGEEVECYIEEAYKCKLEKRDCYDPELKERMDNFIVNVSYPDGSWFWEHHLWMWSSTRNGSRVEYNGCNWCFGEGEVKFCTMRWCGGMELNITHMNFSSDKI